MKKQREAVPIIAVSGKITMQEKKLAAQKRTLPIPTEHDYAYGRESNLNVIALVPSGFSLNPSFC
jgi:hypothetical protein